MILAQWALLVGLDLAAYQWAVRIHGLPAWTLGVGILAAGVVIELVLVVTRLRLRPAAGPPIGSSGNAARSRPRSEGGRTGRLTDPVGYTCLAHDQHRLWDSPQTIALQRHAHHGVALGSIALVGVAMVEGWVGLPQPWGALAAVAGASAVVLGIAAVLAHSLSAGSVGRAGWTGPAQAARAVGRVAVLLAAGAAAGARMAGTRFLDVTPAMVEGLEGADLDGMGTAGAPVVLPVVREVGMGLTLGYTAACLAVGLVAWLLRDQAGASDAGASDAGASEPGTTRALQAFGLPGLTLLAGAVGGGWGRRSP